MLSVEDGPANQGYMQSSKVSFKALTQFLRKLLLKTVLLLPVIFLSLYTRSVIYLTNKKTDTIDYQPRNDENMLDALLQNEFTYQVDVNLASSATRVMFNDSDRIKKQICLKMWLECQNEVYNTGDLTQRATFLLEGLAFNRQLSGNVYYGIVPILTDSPYWLECGPLIANPIPVNLASDRPYALVMKRLKEEWRLDQQLWPERLGNTQGMEFLAHQVASMHRQLNRSLPEFGTPERIASKLDFNVEQFQKALDKRRADPHIMAESVFNKGDMGWIESASGLLRKSSEAHQYDFKKRHRKNYIRRCHGDLKAANLWICPSDDSSQAQKRLIALDCVDFNPEFCNIDTLSDVAMLAIDLEMRLENAAKSRDEKQSGQELARHFLKAYLKAAGENESVWPLLEYYMTEKAMVCAYMSILYDGLPTLGEKYLQVVLAHSQELAKHLSSQTDKRITGTGMIVCTRQAFARFLSFLRQTKGSQEQAKDLQE